MTTPKTPRQLTAWLARIEQQLERLQWRHNRRRSPGGSVTLLKAVLCEAMIPAADCLEGSGSGGEGGNEPCEQGTSDAELGDLVEICNVERLGSAGAAPAIDNAYNMLNLSGEPGDIIILAPLPGRTSGYFVLQPKHKAVCMINDVRDTDDGKALMKGGVTIAAMIHHRPTEGCEIFRWGDCEEGSGSGSGSGSGAEVDLTFEILCGCCGEFDVGSGVCGSGSGSGSGA